MSIYPSDMGFINVRSLASGEPPRKLATGDGVTDDTEAFEQAISLGVLRNQTVYLPAGMYKVTRPLPWRRLTDNKWAGQCSIEGESQASTVVFLGEAAQGFSDPTHPNAVFITSSLSSIGQPQTATSSTAKPGGNAGPLNSFRDLTIDTGEFPGAQGIDWVCSNRGVIERVRIRGAGVAGIDCSRPYPGPCLIQDVEVEGFAHGIRIQQTQFNVVLRNVVVVGQSISGIEAGGPSGVHIDELVSRNAVPAVRQTSGNNALVVLSATCIGGSAARAAIETHIVGRWLLRDIRALGYRCALRDGTSYGTDHHIPELSSHPVLMTSPTIPATMRIPAEQPPAPFQPTDLLRAVARPSSSARDRGDDRAAIQAALNSGRPYVYLPHAIPGAVTSEYYLSGPLYIPATVQLIEGGDSFLRPTDNYPQGEPALVIEAPSSIPLTIQRLWATGGLLGPTATTPWVEHRSNRPLVIRSSQLAGGNRGLVIRSGAGAVFLLDVFASFDITDGHLYAWQLNTELRPDAPVVNFTANYARNSVVRVVGFKTEQDFVSLHQIGGIAEFLGCHLMPGVGTGGAHPVQPTWIVQDGELACSYKIFSDGAGESPEVQLLHTKAGETRKVMRDALSKNPGETKTHDFAPLVVVR